MADVTLKEDGEKEDIDKEAPKRGRGRPKKEEKEKEQANKLRSYLEKGTCSYVSFSKSRKVEHSPVSSQRAGEPQNKDNKEWKEEEAEGRQAKETKAGEQERSKDNDQKELGSADGTTATGKKEETPDLPTETDEKRREEEGESGESAATESKSLKKKTEEGDTEPAAGEAEEELAIIVRLVKVLENKIEKASGDRKLLGKEMHKLREQVDREIEGRKVMSREIEYLKKMRKEDRVRLEELEKELDSIREKMNVNTAIESLAGEIENDRNEEDRREEGEIEEEEIGRRQEEGGGADLNNNQGRIERGYLENMPDKLGKEELEWEMAERRSRKKSIVIHGIRTVGAKLKEEVKGIIKES